MYYAQLALTTSLRGALRYEDLKAGRNKVPNERQNSKLTQQQLSDTI
jgi:hypothetical protein